jgi:cytochrome c oxidase assembly protein subunit 11
MVEANSKSNTLMMKKLFIFTLIMFVFGYALVPFYEKFCEVTGINNLLRPDVQVKENWVDESRWITIEFDANTRGLPWQFRPLQTSARVHPGEPVNVMYEITNNSDREISGQAIPSYSPRFLDKYLKKFECFCFTKQVLKPRETRQMPVQFVIEPGISDEIHTVTVSYTFFELSDGASAVKK